MLGKIFVVSKDTNLRDIIKKQVLISFPTADFGSCKTTKELSEHSLEFGDVIIYNSESNGPIPQTLINSTGGYWLNISEKIDEATQMRSLVDGFSGIISIQDNIDKYPRVIRCMQSGEIWFSRQIIAFAIRQYQTQSITSEE
ncbi:hypothetical protein JCM19235_6624 [Vibrio maritimus]|uniref:Uncharacterized protein n=1 Tax=Vibrio maritimus TaxID=990268 RepID=A0A090RS26_9VIBR|nr:hypothetical protein JCM19235_6624 [Vibrio maritimus]